MGTRTLSSALILMLAAYGATARGQTAPPASGASNYAWAESCRKCHEAVYDAWAKTKHAGALGRLSSSEQEQPCVGCHLTGPKTRVFEGSRAVNAGVQCEACHGAAKAHVADPTVTAGLTKVPLAAVCEECHSEKSPRFKGFFYSSMVGLSHKVR